MKFKQDWLIFALHRFCQCRCFCDVLSVDLTVVPEAKSPPMKPLRPPIARSPTLPTPVKAVPSPVARAGRAGRVTGIAMATVGTGADKDVDVRRRNEKSSRSSYK